ncbi:MAG: DUF349 domain-containing protein, partial [Burkholderiales bacterium]
PLAKEIRDIQEEWKALDKKNGGAPKPKWDKFNAECKAAYAPAKAHFDALRKQRTENASGREKVIADMHALAEEAAAPAVEGQNRDWASLERRKSALFDQWKKAGSVANSAWKSLDEKLDAALGKLDTALDGAREPELSRRRKLILRAEELSKASPSREVTEEAIAIQRRWTAERIQNAPHLRRKDEQKMWDDFKKHTDAVFKARDAQRDSMKAQFSEATKARFEVIDEVKALANGDDAKAIDAAMNAARTKWRNLPFVDRDKARDLDRKFDDAVMAAKRRATVLSLSKGFVANGTDAARTELLPQAMRRHRSKQAGLLSGPSFAGETARGLPLALVCAMPSLDDAQQLANALRDPAMRIYASDDLIGVAVCGAVKNVFAIAAGISDGFALGANARAALVTRGLAEMRRLVAACGGNVDTVSGLAGVGDVLLTTTGDASRNRRVGLELAAGKSLAEILAALGHVAEGVNAARLTRNLAAEHNVEMPISSAVAALIEGSLTPKAAIEALLTRKSRAEF